MRLFVAVEIPEEIRNRLALLQEDLKKTGQKARYVAPENLHLTLKFIGEAEPGPILEMLGSLKAKPFEVDVRGVGVFPGVVWAGLEPTEPLAEMANQIELMLKLPKERRGFLPHLTIARLEGRPIEFLRKHGDDFFGRFCVSEFKLKQSILTPKGPIYSDLGVWKL